MTNRIFLANTSATNGSMVRKTKISSI